MSVGLKKKHGAPSLVSELSWQKFDNDDRTVLWNSFLLRNVCDGLGDVQGNTWQVLAFVSLDWVIDFGLYWMRKWAIIDVMEMEIFSFRPQRRNFKGKIRQIEKWIHSSSRLAVHCCQAIFEISTELVESSCGSFTEYFKCSVLSPKK